MTSVTDQLKDLAALYREGMLTREEFEAQKRALLGDSSPGTTPPPSSTPATPAPTDDLTGQRIGEYRLDRKLGEGGMGAVYLASHTSLDQQVAVKVLDPGLARSAEVRERFIQEANIQVKLQHPGIVRVLTASTEGPHLALVMEYVDGLSLAQVIERRGALPVDEALGLFRQVLDAVGHAHDQGIVHRDIKPSNVMVQADGTARVMDFGIAKVVGGEKLTRTGTVMGSAHYMSPEQILGSKEVDHRTDIYSLGITFYEVLTGRTPFEGVGGESTDSDFLIKLAHKEQRPSDPRTVRGDLPQSVAVSLLESLNKAPDKRFNSCETFMMALYISAEPAQDPAPDPPWPLEGHTPASQEQLSPLPLETDDYEILTSNRSFPWVPSGFGLALLVLVAGLAALWKWSNPTAVNNDQFGADALSEREARKSQVTDEQLDDIRERARNKIQEDLDRKSREILDQQENQEEEEEVPDRARPEPIRSETPTATSTPAVVEPPPQSEAMIASEVVVVEETTAEDWFMLGSMALSGGNCSGAIPHLQEAAAMVPQNANYNYKLGLALIACGRKTDAMAPLSQAASSIPDARKRLDEIQGE